MSRREPTPDEIREARGHRKRRRDARMVEDYRIERTANTIRGVLIIIATLVVAYLALSSLFGC